MDSERAKKMLKAGVPLGAVEQAVEFWSLKKEFNSTENEKMTGKYGRMARAGVRLGGVKQAAQVDGVKVSFKDVLPHITSNFCMVIPSRWPKEGDELKPVPMQTDRR